MLDSLVVFATQKANDFSSGAVTTIDREIIRFFNLLINYGTQMVGETSYFP